MPGLADVDIRFYSGVTANRRRVPSITIGAGSRWRFTRYGGYAEATFTISGDPADLTQIQEYDRCRVFVGGTLRYSGFVSQTGRTLGDPATLQIACQGLWSQIAVVPVDSRVIFPTVKDATDVFASFANIEAVKAFADRYSDGRAPFQVSICDPLHINAQVLDAFNQNLGAAFQSVGDLVTGLATFGCDEADSDLGQPPIDRLYLRAVSSRNNPDYTIALPGPWNGAGVQVAEGGPDVSRLANVLQITGAAPQYPNLLAAGCNGNTDFEHPILVSDTLDSVILNPSFDAAVIDAWSYNAGASQKKSSDIGGSTHSSDYMLLLDNVGENAKQTTNSAFTSKFATGDTWAFGCFLRFENPRKTLDDTATVRLGIQWKNGGANVGGLVFFDCLLGTAPNNVDTEWRYFTVFSRVPGGTITGFEASITLTAKNTIGVCGDDAYGHKCAIRQDGWRQNIPGGSSATFNVLDWANTANAYHGRYSVYLDVSSNDADGDDCWIEPINRCPIVGGSPIFFQYFALAYPGFTEGDIFSEIRFYDASGKEISGSGVISPFSLADDTQWIQAASSTVPNVSPGNAYTFAIRVTFRGDWKGWLDSFLVRNGDTSIIFSGGTEIVEWIPDGAYQPSSLKSDGIIQQTGIDVTTVIPEFQALLSTAAQNSINTFGRHYAQIQTDAVYNLATAYAVAAAYFNIFAVPLVHPTVTLTGSPVAFVPGQAIRLAGKVGRWIAGQDNGETDNGNVFLIAEIEESIDAAGLVITVLSTEVEPPTLDRIIRELFGIGAQSMPGGGISGYAPGSVGSGGGGGASVTAGYTTVQDEGVDAAAENTLNFIGPGVSAVDNPGNASTDVTFAEIPIVIIVITAATAWAQPLGTNEFLGTTATRIKVDLTNAETVRLGAMVLTAGESGATLFPQYSTDGGSTWAALVTSSGASIAIDSTGQKESGWKAIVAGAKGDVLLRIVGTATLGIGTPLISELGFQFRQSALTT